MYICIYKLVYKMDQKFRRDIPNGLIDFRDLFKPILPPVLSLNRKTSSFQWVDVKRHNRFSTKICDKFFRERTNVSRHYERLLESLREDQPEKREKEKKNGKRKEGKRREQKATCDFSSR